MTLDFCRLRLAFIALEPIHFPADKPGNVLRGAFSNIFRQFEPAALPNAPSGLVDCPKPFVFRARHLDGRTIMAGETFYFEINCFAVPSEDLGESFAAIGLEGLGHSRGRARLENFAQEPVSHSLRATAPVSRLRVHFLTPTELKPRGQPEFPTLFARIRDRISTLRALYGRGPLDIDFKSMGDRSTHIRMSACDTRAVSVTRRSSRTGQIHGLGGFIGSAQYEGDLTEFYPYLTAAQWTGVGRHTAFGNGEIEVGQALPPAL